MAITSEDIHNQSFTIDRKGYNVDEVDVFLEHVAAEIDGLNDYIAELLDQVDQLSAASASAGRYVDEPMDMDAAFAEPAMPTAKHESKESTDDLNARIAELEAALAEKENDASAISAALVTAQRSAKQVVDAAQNEAKRIQADAEAEASDIIERANNDKAKVEDAIAQLEGTYKTTCENYAEALKAFVEDANNKIDDIEDALAKKDGKKRSSHARFTSPAQAPVHKPAPVGTTGAVAPSYVAPAATAAAVVAAEPAAPVVNPAPAGIEKDLSGFGDASDAFDLGDID